MWIIAEIINTITNLFFLKKKSKKGKKITWTDTVISPTFKILLIVILLIVILKIVTFIINLL